MRQRHKDLSRFLHLPNPVQRLFGDFGVGVEASSMSHRAGRHAHRSSTYQDGSMMTTIAAHKHPLIWPCQRERAQVSRHVARGVDQVEAAVAKVVVGALKRAEWLPIVLLKAELTPPRMLQERSGIRRLWVRRPSFSSGSLTSRARDHLGVGKFHGVANVVKVKMAEDDGADTRRRHGAARQYVKCIFSNNGLNDVE